MLFAEIVVGEGGVESGTRLRFPNWPRITQLCRGEDLGDPVLSGFGKFPRGDLTLRAAGRLGLGRGREI